MKRTLLSALLSLLVVCHVESQERNDAQLRADKTAAHQRLDAHATGCPATPVLLPASLSGSISFSSCVDPIGVREDAYAITVSAGETVDITFRSAAFEVFLYMYLGSGTSIDTTRVSNLISSSTSLVTARHTFTAAGTYIVEAGALWSGSTSLPWRGAYTLTIGTSKVTGGGACVADPTTVCLLNNRFRVSIAYVNPFSNPPNQPGTFLAARLLQGAQNPDVALFGFANAQAVEVVVRVQDARPFAPRFDIYYGGMTDVGYTVTVTDTQTGTVRQYVNPAGRVGGGVDRSSFPALASMIDAPASGDPSTSSARGGGTAERIVDVPTPTTTGALSIVGNLGITGNISASSGLLRIKDVNARGTVNTDFLAVDNFADITEHIRIAGIQVVGSQGTAVNDATDAASAIARLNDLLARLRSHGLIARH